MQNKRKLNFLETINTLGPILIRASSVQESTWSVAKNAVEKLGYIYCIIYLINDDGELYQCAAHGNEKPIAQDIQNPIKLNIGEGICGHVALTGIGEVIADTSKDPRYLVDREGQYSEIAVPIISDGVVIGIIDSEHPEKGYFSDDDLNILTAIASMLSLKISQTKVIEEKDEWANKLATNNKKKKIQNKEKGKRVDKIKIIEARFQMLLKASEDMITIHQPNGKYIYYNGPSCYALNPEDIVGKMPSDLFDKEVSNTLMNAFEKVEKTGESKTVEVLLDWLGEKKWFSEYIYPIKNADGKTVEIVKVCRDIHQRKLAEQKIENQNKSLIESDKTHRDVLEASSDLIVVVNKNGQILFINNASKKFYGLPPKDFIGKSIFDFTHPEDKEYTQNKLIEWGNSEKNNFHFENNQINVIGEILETEWHVNIERRGTEIIKITSIIRDVTKQNITRTELIKANKESEEFFNFFRLSPDIMVIANTNGIFKSINPATTSLLGYSEEELTSKPFTDFIHPDDIQTTLKEFEKINNEGTISIDFENRYLSKNNGYLLLSWRAHFNEKEKVTYATARNITNERFIETELIKSKKRAVQNEEKQKRAEELIIANKELVFQGEEKDELIDELIIIKEEKVSRVEALAIAKEKIVVQGEEKADLIDELTIVRKEKLSRVEALAIAKEKIVIQGEEKADLLDELVIANKELEFQNEEKAKRASELEFKIKYRTQELEESLEREKELGILKTNFVSMASHEFRTPLTSIKVTSDVILRYFDKLNRNDIDERLEKIKREVEGMTVMLEDILIIGKSESQKLHYDPSILDIVSLIKHIISDYQISESENRQIVYDISSPIIEVNVDKKWIKHIVLNLISNAIKYSDKEELIEITIEEKNSNVSFCFKDHGIGISKQDIKLLFEPFHRGENVKNISGTGLGLSVLKKAVDLHNGKIEVESKVNKGSSFKVTLPNYNFNEKI